MQARLPRAGRLPLALLFIALTWPLAAWAGKLHFAAEIGDTQRIAQLVRLGADINEIDNRGIWPLLAAVTYDNREAVALLLQLGAEPNLADQYNYTALHEAACLGYREVAEILIEAKADINKRDINGYSPLGYAVRCGHQGVIELLQAHGAILSPATNEAP